MVNWQKLISTDNKTETKKIIKFDITTKDTNDDTNKKMLTALSNNAACILSTNAINKQDELLFIQYVKGFAERTNGQVINLNEHLYLALPDTFDFKNEAVEPFDNKEGEN